MEIADHATLFPGKQPRDVIPRVGKQETHAHKNKLDVDTTNGRQSKKICGATKIK
jgi:hypothetical protein